LEGAKIKKKGRKEACMGTEMLRQRTRVANHEKVSTFERKEKRGIRTIEKNKPEETPLMRPIPGPNNQQICRKEGEGREMPVASD